MQKLLRVLPLMFALVPTGFGIAQSPAPKHEFRGAWIATVINLDWPSSNSLSTEAQQAELLLLLDEMQEININAVVFQVRSESDAMYASSYEPWSYWLTGQQGRAPEPFYDPLEFAITEAHRRGMELHAWFNPYRVERQAGNYGTHPTHVSKQHPEWTIRIGDIRVLDPGLPQARQHITNVVMDVVNRYDVDGVHFDDYFYPYPPNQITTQDNATFANYNRGFGNRGDWRRDNVNLMIAMVYDSIQAVKPYVKFGISPFGIWKNGVPSGIVGLDAYNVIYADAVAWLQRQIIDYITPQLYWPFGGGQDYGKLQPWWSFQTNGRHLYVGQAAYRIVSWDFSEYPDQIRLNRVNPYVQGSVHFRAKEFRGNPNGIVDSLKTDFYRFPAIAPKMPWKDEMMPTAPLALRYERLSPTGPAGLIWDEPVDANRYAVYRFDNPAIQPEDYDDPANLLRLTFQPANLPPTPPNIGGPYYFAVTALDRNASESSPSNVIAVSPPSVPSIAFPFDGSTEVPDSVLLRWNYPELAASYDVQVALDSTFATGLIAEASNLLDTSFAFTGVVGQETYYWRVNAHNAGGTSAFAPASRFTTAFPAAPMLASPSNGLLEVSINPTLAWHAGRTSTSYRVQMSRSPRFGPSSTILDTTVIADTSLAIAALEPGQFHYWRVNATNEYGTSEWSSIWRFQTEAVTAVAEGEAAPTHFALEQNYPNPFNPTTTIAFELPSNGIATLSVYDLLGREVMKLIDGQLPAGRHLVIFNAAQLPSGVYIYRLRFGAMAQSRRMLVVK